MMSELNAKARKASATVQTGGKAKFPIPDKKHARLALDLLRTAKPPLSASQKAAVRKRAASFGVTSKKPAK